MPVLETVAHSLGWWTVTRGVDDRIAFGVLLSERKLLREFVPRLTKNEKAIIAKQIRDGIAGGKQLNAEREKWRAAR